MAKEKGYTVSQIALSWLLNQKENVFPIVSASTGQRIRENMEALQLKLTEEEKKWLNLEE